MIRGRGQGSPEGRIPRAVGPEIKALPELGFWSLGVRSQRAEVIIGQFSEISRVRDCISSGVRVLETVKKCVRNRIQG